MPELPDLIVYIEAIQRHLVGKILRELRVTSPFLVRSVDPPIQEAVGNEITDISRLGKRLVFALGEGPDQHCLVLHLMIAGRLRWYPAKKAAKKSPARPPKNLLATFVFDHGELRLTEASSRKRASLYLVRGADALALHDPGGIEPLGATLDDFVEALTARNHTIKRALTDPRILAGIGNAYSDEILHRCKLSPYTWTSRLSVEEQGRLYAATQDVLREWVERLRRDVGDGFPDKVTAFRNEMAVHGKYRQPCPACGAKVQRIRYAENEANYCPTCQTGGKLLADRSLSKLMKSDWPRTLDELETKMRDLER